MKFAVLAAVVAYASASGVSLTAPEDRFLAEEELIEHVNSLPGNTWTAGVNDYHKGWTVDEIKFSMGTTVESKGPKVYSELDVADVINSLPKEYDARTEHGKCIHPVRNQGRCGSCWSFGASEALSDRFCMAGHDVLLAPQYLVSCDPVDLGCYGGQLFTVWGYMRFHGLPAESCDPYTSGESEISGSCIEQCEDGTPIKFYKAKSVYPVVTWFDTEESAVQKMMAEIYKNGPIEAAYMVYQDFMSYKGGVYKYTKGPLMGGHAIKIVGWGTDEKQGDYWIVQNSWGADWGLDGFFWIEKGVNSCNIEANAWAGLPDVEDL
ncbi:hypothetical protein SARC_01783 [Sphaeroforma arctica JP610]|uniref:Peptidase C1A papain C-terminal domain-containing protein n=1 Tax=Sphaeroforma arctica JP610 TaxID=667725 RepID=A0A0L0GAR0_9EUKA|nr:hypothetical protein SARC_01783 [Sphaeroforma arctica JP610]KNC86060.1 hypothetical protein SARC_01783 [Sphaeroforma arctica JP610]|eukprot:XP_014159962.1 hypothetical protein SARC_01783 [Sphaeroforma arctica JP610]